MGRTKKEVKVDVVELELPIIGMEGGNDVTLETGEKHLFKPEVSNKEGLKFSWSWTTKRCPQPMNILSYRMRKESIFINLKATNEDG